MKKRILTVGLVAILAGLHHLKAQDPIYIGEDVYMGRFQQIKEKLDYSDVEGSPYLREKLTRGFVQFKHGDSVSYYLRYDMYGDEMEYLDGEQLFAIVNMDEVEYIQFNGYKVVYKDYFTNDAKFLNDNKFLSDNKKTGYLFQLISGRCNLYQGHQTEFIGEQPAKSNFHQVTPAHFKKKRVQWYYSCDSRPITSFPADNNGLKQISESYSYYDLLSTYMNENNLKMKNDGDVVVLFKYYNSLVEAQVMGETK